MIKVDHNVKARKRLARKVYFVSEGQLLGFITDSPGPPFVNGVPICTNNAVPMVPMLLNLSTKKLLLENYACLQSQLAVCVGSAVDKILSSFRKSQRCLARAYLEVPMDSTVRLIEIGALFPI